MTCDSCGAEVYRLTISPGIGWVCRGRCNPHKHKANALFASIPHKHGIKTRGFRKAEFDMIGSRQLDDYGNVYEHGKLVEELSHKTCVKMDARVRERIYALKHRQPDPSAGWHKWNPDFDTRPAG